MRALLFSISLLVILAVGCGEPPETKSDDAASGGQASTAKKETVAEGGMAFEEVNAEQLESTLANHKVTLIEFTADW